MDQLPLIIVLVVVFFALLGSGLWVALSLLAAGMVAMEFFTSAPVGLVLATTVWGASNSWALATH